MRRLLVIGAVVAVLVYMATPPRARDLPAPPAGIATPVRGAMHVHSRRSDGTGTIDQIAEAASRAGLRFVIVTDHGDATRPAYPPEYRAGVLVIDAVEISTGNGHVIALGLPTSPYPLAGEARDVVEDVIRMGGFAIAAHPASRKADLRWTDWDVPVQGIEYLNGDSEWRDEPAWDLARALLAYPVRPVETLGRLFDRSDETFRHWDGLVKTRRVVGLAGLDAHGSLALLRADEPYRGRVALPVPGYESVFRSLSIALPRAQLSSDAARDGAMVLNEIREGRVFSSVDALAARPAFDFIASSGGFRASGGEVLPVAGPVRIAVAAQAPSDARIVLRRDGIEVKSASGTSLDYSGDAMPAAYRAEVTLADSKGPPQVPWIVSNPIYITRPGSEPPSPPTRPVAGTKTDVYTNGPAPEWTVEHSSPSRAAFDVVKAVSGTQLLLRYALSGGPSSHPYAALVAPAGPALKNHDRLTFTVQADKPMRLSVQLRAATADPVGERWHRSVFVDATSREVSIRFDDMRPRGATSSSRPVLERIQSILFVVDTENTPAGTAGQVTIDDVRYER